MRLSISHTTRYAYDQPVDYAVQRLRLRPAVSRMQAIMSWDIAVSGGRLEASYADHYGNLTDLVSLEPGTQEVAITAMGEVETSDTSGIMGMVFGRAPLWHFTEPTSLTRPGPALRALAKGLRGRTPTVPDLHGLSREILAVAPYTLGATTAETTAEDALKIGAGVCQDHAQVFVSVCREIGLPARYVSGYLMMNDRVDQDASHAWAEVFVPDLGWVGFDVSNGVSPDERYVRLAIGRDASDAGPISGLRHGRADETLDVSLQVQQ